MKAKSTIGRILLAFLLLSLLSCGFLGIGSEIEYQVLTSSPRNTYGEVFVDFSATNSGAYRIDYFKVYFIVYCQSGKSYSQYYVSVDPLEAGASRRATMTVEVASGESPTRIEVGYSTLRPW